MEIQMESLDDLPPDTEHTYKINAFQLNSTNIQNL
jgi:hypothetical protein